MERRFDGRTVRSTSRVWPFTARYSSLREKSRPISSKIASSISRNSIGALDRQVRLGDDRSSEQAHRLDGVLRRSELHIGVDALNAMDAQCGRPNAVDLDSEVGQEDAEVLDHVVRAGIAQHRHPSRQRRSEQRVLGDGVAAFGEGDRPGRSTDWSTVQL